MRIEFLEEFDSDRISSYFDSVFNNDNILGTAHATWYLI